jgi:hypothetical protein
MNATDGEMIVTYGLICMSGDVVVVGDMRTRQSTTLLAD